MKTSFKNLIFWILFLTSIHASAQEMITSSQAEISPYLKKQLTSKLKNYQLLTLPLLPTTKNKEQLSFQLQTLTEKWEIELHPNEIRTPDCKIIEFDGKNSKELTVADCPTFAGTVNGYEARFYINSELLSGTIYQKDDILTIEPLSWFLSTNEFKDVLIIFKESDIIETGGVCGVKSTINQLQSNQTSSITSLPVTCKMLNVAIEYDYEFYLLGGANQALSIMQNVDYIYFRDIGVRVNVSWMGGWSSKNAPYPYSNNTLFTTVSAEFWSYWNTNRGYVNRDIAHMFTGKNLTPPPVSPNLDVNGEANLVNICSASKSYSMSDRGNGSSNDWASCASHEIGHNLGHGGHDNDISNTFCDTKYIMCTGMTKNGYFSPNSKTIIANFLNSTSCLVTRTPSIVCKIDNNTINSTPTYISGGSHVINVISNDTYINNNSFTYAPNNSSVSYYPSGNSCSFTTNGVSSFTMQITYTNTCGTFYRAIPFVIYSSYKIYPNPSKDYLTVAFDIDASFDNSLGLPSELNLFNEKQELVKNIYPQESYKTKNLSSQNNKVIFDLRTYPKGLYYLHVIYTDGKTDKVKVLLE